MGDFVGINIHSGAIFQNNMPPNAVQLYLPATGLVRDYHNLGWDLTRTDDDTKFPRDKWNWCNWNTLYGQWVDVGVQVNACIQFGSNYDSIGEWINPAADARKYGEAFATAFGPTVGSGVVTSVQIGNEPGGMTDSLYRTIFQNMAEGIRAVDPAIIIVTCNTEDSPSGDYHKSMSVFVGLEHLVDAYATHSYPMLKGWPSYERSYPEDTRMSYLTKVQGVINRRDAYDPTAEVWITEFGYDSTSKPTPTSSGWMDVTDTQHAQWLIRSYLIFSEMDMDRAYMYFYNDSDGASVHASSGLTRNGNPKQVYWAQCHLLDSLADYRFSQVIQKVAGNLYIYAYQHKSDPTDVIWVLWSPTGSGRTTMVTLTGLPGMPLLAERMPLTSGTPLLVDIETLGPDAIRLEVAESPTYLHFWVDNPDPEWIPGDYNEDGYVDLADYTVWADHYGLSGSDLPGDGNGDGVVDLADYTIWADHFGQGTPAN
jgi:serine/threonine-protein kinase ATR